MRMNINYGFVMRWWKLAAVLLFVLGVVAGRPGADPVMLRVAGAGCLVWLALVVVVPGGRELEMFDPEPGEIEEL